MRKQFLCVFTLVLLTLLLFVSCSGSLTDTLLKVMDGTDTNVYIKTGIVKPNTEAVDKVLEALKTETTPVTVAGDNTLAVTIGGQSISVEVSDDVLKIFQKQLETKDKQIERLQNTVDYFQKENLALRLESSKQKKLIADKNDKLNAVSENDLKTEKKHWWQSLF